MRKPLIAVLDTCVLYPAVIRDTLLLAAEVGAYQLRWTEDILLELRRNLLRLAAPEARVDRMLADLRAFFDDGRVTGHERHIAELRNDPKDRHVVAAAVEGGAEFVVTENLRDFPYDAMPPGIRATSVDEFLSELLERRPAETIEAVWCQATRKKRPPVPVERVLEAIARVAPEFARAASPLLSIRTDAQLSEIVNRLDRALAPTRESSGTADLVELSAALSDACVVFPRMADELAKEARPHVPMAVRLLAKVVADSGNREAAEALCSRGVDPAVVDVSRLSDEEIHALLERNRETTQ